jgi:hypothetical protein
MSQNERIVAQDKTLRCDSLYDPDKWIQGHPGKGERKCWSVHLSSAGARIGEGLDRIKIGLLDSGSNLLGENAPEVSADDSGWAGSNSQNSHNSPSTLLVFQDNQT